MGKDLVATGWDGDSVLVETESGEYEFFKVINSDEDNPIKITTEEALDMASDCKLKGDAYEGVMGYFSRTD